MDVKEKEERLFSCWHENEWCLQLHAYKVSIPFPPIYNQSIPIYLSIGIDNRYQSITTWIFAIDWSSIININRLIDIDWYRLISIVIDYLFPSIGYPGFDLIHMVKKREQWPPAFFSRFDGPRRKCKIRGLGNHPVILTSQFVNILKQI